MSFKITNKASREIKINTVKYTHKVKEVFSMNKENTAKEYKAETECVTVAYDIGITSIGISGLHEFKDRKPDVKLGVRTFKAGESAKAR